VKLLDFGIAKLRSATEFLEVATAPGSMMGTPEYMAPEQAISADQVDARADLYSFGVIVFEMLGGVRPVETSDLHEIITRLARGQYRSLGSLRPDLPPALVALVDRLVQPDPDKRPSSAAAVRAELDSAVAPGPSNYPGARQSYPVIAATVPPQDRSAPAALASTNLAPPSANAGFVQSRTAAIPAQGFAQGGTAAIPAQGFAQGGTAAIAAPGFAHGGTAAMPRAASGGAAPGSVPGTVSFAQAPPAGRVSVPQVPAFVPGRRRRSRVGIFLLLFLPVSAAAGVGV